MAGAFTRAQQLFRRDETHAVALGALPEALVEVSREHVQRGSVRAADAPARFDQPVEVDADVCSQR